jgi:glycopeptide antibiotics resistance protein
MSEFLRYVFWMVRNSAVLALLIVLGAAAALGAAWLIHRRIYKGQRKFPWRKVFLWLLFVIYLAVVFYVTNFRTSMGRRQVNYHLFRAWREAWSNFSQHRWLNVLLNIAMFAPLGFLLPLLGKKFRKWYLTVPTGFGLSLALELLQLAFARGVCDVDDLFCNTLGAAVGYSAVMTLLALYERRWKSVLPWACLTLVPVAAIAGLFGVYEMKEYGNLPMAPSYTINTRGIAWELACEFPEADAALPVYRGESRTHEDCDAFAEGFKELIGMEYQSVSYYQEEAYYMIHGSDLGAHFLIVRYMDQGYRYSAHLDDEPQWLDAEREAVEAALEDYPVFIPEEAEFTADGEGWYSFTADRITQGEQLCDGVLRVRVAADGTVRELENGLLTYRLHDTIAVITPEEAAQRLMAGKFSDGAYFEMKKPETVTILSWEQHYTVDTKGFYQPVYAFQVVSGDYEDQILIPAAK